MTYAPKNVKSVILVKYFCLYTTMTLAISYNNLYF